MSSTTHREARTFRQSLTRLRRGTRGSAEPRGEGESHPAYHIVLELVSRILFYINEEAASEWRPRRDEGSSAVVALVHPEDGCNGEEHLRTEGAPVLFLAVESFGTGGSLTAEHAHTEDVERIVIELTSLNLEPDPGSHLNCEEDPHDDAELGDLGTGRNGVFHASLRVTMNIIIDIRLCLVV